jgi:hypothetical protein
MKVYKRKKKMFLKFNRKHEMNFKSTNLINRRFVFIFIAYGDTVCYRTLRPLFHPDYNIFHYEVFHDNFRY